MRRILEPRALATIAVVIVAAAAAIFAPHPSIVQIREWAHSVGPAFPLVFFLVHAVVTIAPVPRTVFTLSAGLLFGPVTGVGVTVAATTVSAVLAFVLVRSLGRDVVKTRLTHPSVKAIDASLARRGWLAVASLRLIAPIPFAVINYCCGVSAVRLLPFAAASFFGVIPGTVGIVVLGNALGGSSNPALLILSGMSIAIGLAGVVYEMRVSRPSASPEPALITNRPATRQGDLSREDSE